MTLIAAHRIVIVGALALALTFSVRAAVAFSRAGALADGVLAGLSLVVAGALGFYLAKLRPGRRGPIPPPAQRQR